jgi:hypothetical protein
LGCPEADGRSAGWKPAIQQVENLRYDLLRYELLRYELFTTLEPYL